MNYFSICRYFLFKCGFDHYINKNNYIKDFILCINIFIYIHAKKVKY